MKTIFETLKFGVLAIAVLPLAAIARDEPKNGFVRLANAVAAGSGMLTMEIDGARTNEKGYRIGDVTGGVSVEPGMRTVRFARLGTKEGSTRVGVEPNKITILIPFAERIPATEDEPAHWAIRVLRLKQRDPEEDRSATFVSVSHTPEIKVEMRELKGGWNPVLVKRLAVTQAPILFPRGYVPLRTADGDLVSIPVASKGNYVVLLYDDEQGKVRSLNFRDRKFLSTD